MRLCDALREATPLHHQLQRHPSYSGRVFFFQARGVILNPGLPSQFAIASTQQRRDPAQDRNSSQATVSQAYNEKAKVPGTGSARHLKCVRTIRACTIWTKQNCAHASGTHDRTRPSRGQEQQARTRSRT